MRETAPDEPILFFGTGPTLHHVFLSADRASEIHLADYLPQNLAAIERWLQRDPGAHDWRPFVRYTLECEGERAPTEAQLAEREELTRAKVTRLLEADAGDREPVGERYGTVVSAYCADSATADRATWEAYMRHIAGLVRPGGVFITAALRRSRSYLVGGKEFPSADVDEHDLRAVLEPEFDVLDRGPRGARARAARLRGHRARYGHSTPTSVGSGSSLTPKRSSTPPAISRASASSSAVVPAPRLVSASVCLDEIAIPSGLPWPLWKPARSISQAAEVLTRPSSSGKRGGRSGARCSSAANASADRIGLVKNEPARDRVGVVRVEHHALAAAQAEHRLAHVGERRALAGLHAERARELGVGERARQLAALERERDREHDPAPGVALERARAVGEAAVGGRELGDLAGRAVERAHAT